MAFQKGAQRPFRFHFFTVWSHGLFHIDEILSLLRKDENIEILRIERNTFKNIRRFIFDFYGSDAVPVSHLRAKLAYLFQQRGPKEVINIFVKNYNPQEVWVGSHPFRKEQCQYIVEIKKQIRNLYNPKAKDPNFCVFPLDKGVSHEHMIHASDREEQVDYYLKLLGHKNGIETIVNDDKGLLFEKPYHIHRPVQYSFHRLPIHALLASILTEEKGVSKKLVPIIDTPHFKGLQIDSLYYKKYLETFRFSYLCDDYSLERFMQGKKMTKAELLQLPPILVKSLDNGKFQVLDGVHRASLLLFAEIEKIKCVLYE